MTIFMVMIINNIITTQRQYTERKNQKTNKTIEEKHNTESSIVPFERAMLVSYILYSRLYWDHCAISDQSVAICHRMSATLKSTGGASLWVKTFGVFPWSRSVMLDISRLTNREIIFEEFQPMSLLSSQYLNVTDGRTDGQITCQVTITIGEVVYKRSPKKSKVHDEH